jgi:hypothetical protein
MTTDFQEHIPSDSPNTEISQYDLSISLIDQYPNLTFKELKYELLVYWTLGNILTAKHKFLLSEQWSIFLHAFKQFEKEFISEKSIIHYSFLIELARYWEENLYEINSKILNNGWPEEVEIFQFEKWIQQITSDKEWTYSLNVLRLDHDRKGRMVIR